METASQTEKKAKHIGIGKVTLQEIAIKPEQSSIDRFITLAIENNLDIDKIEKFLQMKERNDKEVARRLFVEALSLFQGECPPLTKDKNVSFKHKDGSGETNYNYHQLPAIEKHIKPYLAKNGLSYRWAQKEEGSKVWVWLIISHSGGHVELGEPISGEPDESGKKNNIQKKASTISYLRRYTLTGGFGLSSGDKDDDGKGGSGTTDLPKLKDSQITAIISRLFKKEETWETLEVKCIINESQKALINEGLKKMGEETKP